MSKVLLVVASLLSLGSWCVPAPAQAEGLARTIAVRIDPTTSAVDLGGAVDLSVEVTNNGAASSPPLVVHLDITDPARSTSVDPEDWTATLSRRVGRVAAGASVTVDWTIQPISSGTLATYAVVLSLRGPTRSRPPTFFVCRSPTNGVSTPAASSLWPSGSPRSSVGCSSSNDGSREAPAGRGSPRRLIAWARTEPLLSRTRTDR